VLNARAGRTIIQEENRSILRLPLRKKRKKEGVEERKFNAWKDDDGKQEGKTCRKININKHSSYYFQNVYEH